MNVEKDKVIHVIPVPIGWSIEQSWEAISRGVLLEHSLGEPTWAVIETNDNDQFIKVIDE